MKYFKRFLVVIALMTFVGSSAFAATNIYDDTYTTEDSSGNWTFTSITPTKTITGVNIIAAPSDTVSSVTAAKSGQVWVLTSQTGPTVAGVGYVLTLPTASSGLEYTFTTATNQTIAVRSASASDVILWGNNGARTQYTSPASTGSTIVVVGSTNRWYVTEMVTPKSGTTNGHDDWVAGSR